jgi:hypothetical protein
MGQVLLGITIKKKSFKKKVRQVDFKILNHATLLAMDITRIGLALAPPCMGPHSSNACSLEHYWTLTKTSATKKQKPLLPHKMGPGFFLPHEMGPWLRFEDDRPKCTYTSLVGPRNTLTTFHLFVSIPTKMIVNPLE